MITTNNNEQKAVRVAFHIGRGGRFHNSGFKSVMPHITRLQECFTEDSYIEDSDAEGNPLPDEKWTLCDGVGNVILEGREAIESETGVLDWDGDYNTDIVKDIEDCSEAEIDLLLESYYDDSCLDDDVIDYIVGLRGLHRISSVNFYKTNADIFFTDHTSISFNYDCDESLDEDTIKVWLYENDIDKRSVEENFEDFVFHFQRD